ncbi:MAG: rhodanese-like domain-containing protein [Chitinophagaceae bacterium]|nr:rhodanese-like domain-containing protein [Bacteroidales bacterium]MBL0135886.1 rhodanese-like domain-containing protein [Chitinophagaceae bacterium]
MKKIYLLGTVILMTMVLILNSCKKDEPEAVNAYLTLKTYLVTNTLDLPDLAKNWIVDPKSTTVGGIVDSVTSTIPAYHVFDIRSAADYSAGHIKNSINVALKDVVTTAASYTDKPILVVCYTGQTAGQAVMALRLSGFANAVVLKWGMAGWNGTFKGPWISNSGFETPANGNIAVGSANWVTSDAPAVGSFTEPVWTSANTDGALILKERVQAVLDKGFSPVAGSDVIANPSAYQIMNYWSVADYTTFGHFSGAYDLPVISLAGDLVKAIDPSKEALVYCYTGQTSSIATFWLNVLGYNTKSIGFGANRLVYDQLKAASKTVYKGPKNWAVVTD